MNPYLVRSAAQQFSFCVAAVNIALQEMKSGCGRFAILTDHDPAFCPILDFQ
jgi:hypothetical protein